MLLAYSVFVVLGKGADIEVFRKGALVVFRDGAVVVAFSIPARLVVFENGAVVALAALT